VSFAPSFAYDYAIRRVREADMANLELSRWRVAGCGAEPIQPDTLAAFSRRFATVGFRDTAWLPCYGMAEHTLAITSPSCGRSLRVDAVRSAPLAAGRVAIPCAPEEADTVRFVSCGRPLPGHELRVVDGNDAPLPDRHVGEIVVRGPSVMRGYDGREDLTRGTVRDGWLHTGDLGYLVDGELFICGREKDVIVIYGRKYHPQDMEWAAGELTGVRRGTAAAFGTNAFGGREQIVIVVERAPGNAGVPDLVERIRARVLERCGVRPDHVVVVPAGRIPRTSSGKVQRARTRACYEAGEIGAASQGGSGG
jgi:fatty-acyl-CoA synthase